MNKAETREVLKAVGVPIQFFCRVVGISNTAYYRWLHGDLNLSVQTEQRIKGYIKNLKKVIE